uniref:Uncharacterized protein n=1 Tax=Echinococcus canadensis TaxID=519352 RepID=A0A915EYW4_9CEST
MNNTMIFRFHRTMQKSTEQCTTWSQHVYGCFMGMDSRTRIFQPIASFLFLLHKHNEQTVNCTGLGLFYTNYYMLFTFSH